jgi:hypothetical protein
MLFSGNGLKVTYHTLVGIKVGDTVISVDESHTLKKLYIRRVTDVGGFKLGQLL